MRIEADQSALLTREEHFDLSKSIAELSVATVGLSLLMTSRLTKAEMNAPITTGTPTPVALLEMAADAPQRVIPLMAHGPKP